MAKYSESFNIELGKRLKLRRLQMGFRSQAAFAEAVGVSRNAVALWETGKNGIDDDNYPALKKALSVGDEFFKGADGAPFTSKEKSDLALELIALIPTLDEIQLRQLIGLAKTPRPDVNSLGQKTKAPSLLNKSK